MKLTHPDSQHPIEVEDTQVDAYTGQGWVRADPPPGNASLAEWQDYARTQGYADAELDGKTRTELREALA